jgi:hypothetical protein
MMRPKGMMDFARKQSIGDCQVGKGLSGNSALNQ